MFAQHFVMILILMINGVPQVQSIPGFGSLATCSLAGEQIMARHIGDGSSYRCVAQ
jgi:hypothetical protein